MPSINPSAFSYFAYCAYFRIAADNWKDLVLILTFFMIAYLAEGKREKKSAITRELPLRHPQKKRLRRLKDFFTAAAFTVSSV
jgi:hypothetical protein